jgi:hypothetical protein
MYYLLSCCSCSELIISSQSELGEMTAIHGILEVIAEGSFLECEKYRDELLLELNQSVLN